MPETESIEPKDMFKLSSNQVMDLIKNYLLQVVFIASLTSNYFLVKYVFDQNAATIKSQQDVLKDYRNNYILSKKVEERAEKLNRDDDKTETK